MQVCTGENTAIRTLWFQVTLSRSGGKPDLPGREAATTAVAGKSSEGILGNMMAGESCAEGQTSDDDGR